MPLQLANDAQIVHHSPFENMAVALQQALVSFAQFAPKNSRFAAKIHPLDPGLVDYRSLMKRWSNHLGVADRVFYLESGNLPALLTGTAGVVTINSTVGGSALIHGKPTIALGEALYNLPGLTFQKGLDLFWTEGKKPDPHLYKNFRNVVIARSQVNGGFYSRDGIRLAVANSVPRMIASRIQA